VTENDYLALDPYAETEDDYFRKAVEIIPEAIREEFVRVPADLAYWGRKYADAVKAALVAEHDRKVTYAEERLRVRALAQAGNVKLTEADVEATVERSPPCRAAKLAEIEAEAGKVGARVALDAVSAKRDMVMSLGAHIRAEMSPTQLNRNR
jgi:hypothetical protein